jgi:hypothetical protein
MFKLNDNQAFKIESRLGTTVIRSINFQNLTLIKSPNLLYMIPQRQQTSFNRDQNHIGFYSKLTWERLQRKINIILITEKHINN